VSTAKPDLVGGLHATLRCLPTGPQMADNGRT
jgi:hypothetical protein